MPFEKYVLDFVCYEYRLIVEIDGAHHDVDIDAPRTKAIESFGYKILRYANYEIKQNLDAVITDVIANIETRKPPPGNSDAHKFA